MVRSVLARLAARRTIDGWLGSLPQQDGIHLLSENSPFAHPEDTYDSQYGYETIDKVLGGKVLNAAGFVPETVLEVAWSQGTSRAPFSMMAGSSVWFHPTPRSGFSSLPSARRRPCRRATG